MKEWGGKKYNTDFYEIFDNGEVSGEKDLAASEGWTNANEPWRNTPGWHGQPLSQEQEAGIKQTNPTGFAERQAWRAANPGQAYGPDGRTPDVTMLGGGGGGGGARSTTPWAPTPLTFNWGNWWNGGASGGGAAGDPLPNQSSTGGPNDGIGLPPGTDGLPFFPGPDPGAQPPQQPAGLSPLSQQVQQAIQSGLQQPSVNPNDPAYRAQIDTNRRNEQRNAERLRAAEAQRANAGGTLNSGGFDARVRGIAENQGNREADFESGLMASELASGRDRQQRAMALGAGLLSQEQQQAMQERLANQGFGLQRYGIDTQRDLSRYGLETQRNLGLNDSTLRRNALMLQQQLGLGDLDLRRFGLENQDAQYYAGLGQQLGLSNAAMNQQAILALLGGY